MKKCYRAVGALFTGVLLIALAAGQGLAAKDKKGPPALHRDGSAFVKESRILQADRQAAADRAEAKGFKVHKVGAAAVSGDITPTVKGAKK